MEVNHPPFRIVFGWGGGGGGQGGQIIFTIVKLVMWPVIISSCCVCCHVISSRDLDYTLWDVHVGDVGPEIEM